MVKARDRSHKQLLRTGFASPHMDEMLSIPEANIIFARLTALNYIFLKETEELHLDLTAFYKRNPHRRRVRTTPQWTGRPPADVPASLSYRSGLEASAKRFLMN